MLWPLGRLTYGLFKKSLFSWDLNLLNLGVVVSMIVRTGHEP